MMQTSPRLLDGPMNPAFYLSASSLFVFLLEWLFGICFGVAGRRVRAHMNSIILMKRRAAAHLSSDPRLHDAIHSMTFLNDAVRLGLMECVQPNTAVAIWRQFGAICPVDGHVLAVD